MEIARNSLSTSTKNNTVATKKESTIYDLVKSMQPQFEVALPNHINTERFVRVALTTLRQNPKLATCKKESLLGALMVSAQLGLEPGILGQSYIIPYGNEAQFQIGYKGMIELLRRSGQLSDIYAYTVYENDEFEIQYGLDRTLKHKPNFENRGTPIGYYAVAILKDNTKAFSYMTVKEIEEHRDKYSKAAKSTMSPWKSDFNAMALKTVIKQMLKYLPISIEWLEKTEKDEKVYNINTENSNPKDSTIFEEPIDITEEVIEGVELVEENINVETGKLIEND